MDHPLPWLRYVKAGDLESSTYNFDNLNVESASGEKLGVVDGFVVDRDSGRPYYVSVDAGGWFKSKLFLLPIGHAAFDTARQRLVSDVGRDHVNRFPGFDRGEFEKLSDDELRRMDQEIVASCCPSDVGTSATSTGTAASSARFAERKHFKSPDWWDSSFYQPSHADTAAAGSASATAPRASMPSRDAARAERDRDRDREAVMAQGGDTSPHLGGRAQPGDVIGVETGGENTHIGDTNDDENSRRRDAEKDAAKRSR